MKPLAKLFSRTPSASDLRLQLKQVERDQWKKRRELDVLEQKKQRKVDEAVAAKKAGRQELVQDIFRDLRQIEIDHGYVESELRRLSLSKTALTAFVRKLEMLEKNKDHRSLQNLIRRYNNSAIQKTIDQAEVGDDTFGAMLKDILGETEAAVDQEKDQEDAGFAEFDHAIEEMATAEAAASQAPAGREPLTAAVAGPHNHASHSHKVMGKKTIAQECPKCHNKCGEWVTCTSCKQGKVRIPCPQCNTTGEMPCPECVLKGRPPVVVSDCPWCGGAEGGCVNCGWDGKLEQPCGYCYATGKRPCNNCTDGYVDGSCVLCDGKGKYFQLCDKCEGRGFILVEVDDGE